MRRIAFICGLILGSSVAAYVLGSALLYLFTGQLFSIHENEDGQRRLVLVDPGTLYEAPSIVPRTADRLAGRPG